MKRAVITDISFWQENPDTIQKVDFKKMKSKSVDGVIFRLGQNLWEDICFRQYWDDSESIGFLRGGYFYYDNRIEPRRQARFCASIIKKHNVKFDLPLWCDFEQRSFMNEYYGWKHWYSFMDELKRELPEFRLGIYTGMYYWAESRGSGHTSFLEKYFTSHPLWLAQYHYTSHMPHEKYIEPLLPPGWNTWEMWQVTDRGDGRAYGVESAQIDINLYNGTKEELLMKYGGISQNKKNKSLTLKYNNVAVRYKEK